MMNGVMDKKISYITLIWVHELHCVCVCMYMYMHEESSLFTA